MDVVLTTGKDLSLREPEPLNVKFWHLEGTCLLWFCSLLFCSCCFLTFSPPSEEFPVSLVILNLHTSGVSSFLPYFPISKSLSGPRRKEKSKCLSLQQETQKKQLQMCLKKPSSEIEQHIALRHYKMLAFVTNNLLLCLKFFMQLTSFWMLESNILAGLPCHSVLKCDCLSIF